MSTPKKAPHVSRWTKPGFMKGKLHQDQFGIPRKGEVNPAIELKIGNASLRWEDTTWVNEKVKNPSKNSNLTIKEIRELKAKNSQLQVECEILLNFLTETEIKKAQLKKELEEKKILMLKYADQVEKLEQNK